MIPIESVIVTQYLLIETCILEDGNLQSVMIDITNKKKSEDVKNRLDHQLLHSQKMEILDRISGGIAHDFNNILQALVLQSELASSLIGSEHPVALDSIRKISETANRGIELTSRLLAFSRKKPLEKIRVDLNQVIENTGELLLHSVGEDWKVHFDPSSDGLGVWIGARHCSFDHETTWRCR
ncbi:MAG: hypothetical protein AAF939_16650 [Planctomycetota bacterium]